MSEATTVAPEAKASVSTIPKLSPPSDGAASTSAARSSAYLVASSTLPSARTPRGSISSGASSSWVGPDHGQLGGDVLAQRLEGAQQQRQALALNRLSDEQDPERVVVAQVIVPAR